MNILDRILYLEKQYHHEYNQAATVIQIGLNLYYDLIKELDTEEEITNLHGMRIDIISDNTIRIDY